MHPTSYHFLQHANGDELLFPYDGNKSFFLSKMQSILLPHIDLLAYCLMTNHFHILFTPKEDLKKSSKAVSNLLNSYAKSFNKLYQRRGSLFLKHPKFVELPLDDDIKRTIKYIHRNPIHHGETGYYHISKWTSYNEIVVGKSEFIDIKKIVDLFGGLENFIAEHDAFKQ